MEYKETDEKTPQKIKYDSNGDSSSIKSFKNLNYDHPFSILPKYSTPPSRFLKIKNPFEAPLIDRLHLPVFSPSVFNKTTPPRSTEKFKWTIDDISTLTPADIDETTIHQVESPAVDPELESSAQKRIDQYFSEKHIVPSPMMMGTHLISTTPPRRDNRFIKSFFHNECQTELSLPPELPAEVEKVLKPYFSYKEDEIDKVLYQNLFECHDPSFESSSVESSPVQPCNLSPVQFSPCQNREQMRNFGFNKDDGEEVYDRHIFNDCNLSPINEEETWRECRSAARLDFSDHNMSIDTSIGCVPNCSILPNNDSTILLASGMESPDHELPSTTETVWDMEFNTVNIKVLDTPSFSNVCKERTCSRTNRSGDYSMEISHTRTPKSKNMISIQRPKILSNSFPFDTNKENIEEDDDDDEILDGVEVIEQRKKTFKSNCFRHLIDDGECDERDLDEDSNEALSTPSTSWFCDDFQRNGNYNEKDHHLVASTPTKFQF